MKSLSVFVFASIFLCSNQLRAQLNHTFSQNTTTPYSEITSGTVVGTSSDDDLIYISSTTGSIGSSDTGTGFPIGFNFSYNGATFDRFAISSNGYIRLGTGTFTILNDADGPLLASTASDVNFNNTIMGLATDITGLSSQSSSIRYATIGTVGSRVLVVQYKAFSRFAFIDNINFQIRLYETSNRIEVHFGTFTMQSGLSVEASVGLRGTGSPAINTRKVTSGTNTWGTSIAATLSTEFCELSSTLFPGANLLYTWQPASLASEPTSQPTGLTFGTVTATTIDYTFTPASGVAGYLQLRKAGSAPTFLPTDGVTYTVDQVLSDGSVVQHADNFANGQATGLTANTTYFWRIFSYNGSGTTTNYLTTNPLQGSRATLGTLATEPTAQPTNLQFTNITATGYDFSFTAANPAPAGYIGIRGIGEEPTTPPEDGLTYAVGDAVGNGFVNFIGTGTSWVQSNATEGTNYHLAIYSYNGTGGGINYLQTNPLRGNVIPTSDSSPPVLTSNNTPTKVAQGQSLKITAVWTDAQSGMSNVDLAYGPTTSTDWTDAAATMVNTSGNTWEFTVPASAISELGFEYRMTAYNMVGLATETAIYRVVVEHGANGLSVPYSSFGESQSNYRIVSVPLVLDKKTVNDVFGDDLGTYDPKNWRMFRYQSGRYAEVTGTTTIELGRGYMFIAKGSTQLDTGPGLTSDTGVEKPFTLTPSNGWNLIGNPFNVDVPWADVQAANAGLSSVKLRVFSGGSFADGSTLQKFSGGFIFVNTTDPITIPHVRSGRSASPEAEPELLNPIDRSNWIVDLELEMGELRGRGGVGMTDVASEGFDKRDEFTVPRFLDFVELNHGKKLYGAHFSRDVVPFAQNHEWSFDVESSDPEGLVTMRWTNAHFGASSKQLVLWDEAQQRAIDMRLSTTYSFKSSESKAFRIIYGDPPFVKEKSTPWGVVFHSVSPVPATDRITFAFSLPDAAEGQEAKLEVYDLMGRRIAQLLDEPLPSGYHEVVWTMDEGRKPQQGTYISVLKVGKASLQKRLMVK